MSGNYTLVVNDSQQVQYESGDGSAYAVANKQPDGRWSAVGRDDFGRTDLGMHDTKRAAKQRLKQFLRPSENAMGSGSGGGSGRNLLDGAMDDKPDPIMEYDPEPVDLDGDELDLSDDDDLGLGL